MAAGKIFIADVKRAVAREFGVPLRVMDEPGKRGSRHADHVRPRQAAMYLSRRLTCRHSTVIGRHFGGRDHSTVFHACKAVEQRMRKDPALHLKIIRLSLELRAGAAHA